MKDLVGWVGGGGGRGSVNNSKGKGEGGPWNSLDTYRQWILFEKFHLSPGKIERKNETVQNSTRLAKQLCDQLV